MKSCKKCQSAMHKHGMPILMSNTKMQTWLCESCSAKEYTALSVH